MVVVVSAGFLESALFEAGFLESATPQISWGEVAEAGPREVVQCSECLKTQRPDNFF